MMKRSGKPSEVIGRMGMSGSLVTKSNSRSAGVIFGDVRSPSSKSSAATSTAKSARKASKNG